MQSKLSASAEEFVPRFLLAQTAVYPVASTPLSADVPEFVPKFTPVEPVSYKPQQKVRGRFTKPREYGQPGKKGVSHPIEKGAAGDINVVSKGVGVDKNSRDVNQRSARKKPAVRQKHSKSFSLEHAKSKEVSFTLKFECNMNCLLFFIILNNSFKSVLYLNNPVRFL